MFAGSISTMLSFTLRFFIRASWWRFLAVRAHWIDIGGTRVGFGYSGTREVYEEGLQFRSLKLYRGEEPNQDLFQLISDNVRFADSCMGDLRAQIAACRIGDRGLTQLVGRYGLDVFAQCVESIWDQSAALAREQVTRIKPGKYAAEALFDSDGVDLSRPVPLKVKIEVAGGEMTIDFSRSAIRCRGRLIPANPASWQQPGLPSNRWSVRFRLSTRVVFGP